MYTTPRRENNFPYTNHPATSVWRVAAFSALLLLLTSASAFANATVTAATGGSAISADNTGGTWTTLTGPVIQEGSLGDIGNNNGGLGTIVLTAPAGFVFNTAATVTVTVVGDTGHASKNVNGTTSGGTIAATVSSSTVTITISSSSSSGGTANTLTWNNIQVRPTAGNPVASGTITNSGTCVIKGVANTTVFGTLTEVIGAPAKVLFVQQPTGVQVGQTISPAVTAKITDQFTNTITTSSATVNMAIGTNPGSGTLAGTTSAPASSGVATFSTLNINNAGNGYTLTAGSTGLTTGTSSTFNISKGSTTTSLGSSANPSVSGQSVTFTATVSATSPASGTATGTVTFKDGATTIGTGTLSAGQATFTTNGLSIPSHSITAVYGGDSNFNTSTSSALTQTVSKADTTTSVGSSANPSVAGQAVTYTATVSASSPGSGTPTGTVTFKDSGTTIGTGTLSSGQATFATNYANTGSHSITVDYAGDSNFNSSSTSSPLSQTVNKTSTTMAITSGANPSVSGQSVTYTATIAVTPPGSGNATGTVTFKDGATTLGTGTLSGNVATLSNGSLTVGGHSITAEYVGDSNFSGSTNSPALSQTVIKASTTMALTSAPSPSVSGQSVTYTATISITSPGSGTATGSVTFKDGATTLGTGTLSGNVATLSNGSLSVGSHSITAEFVGDSKLNGSTNSPALSQTVNKANSSTSVISSVNPSVFGQSVTFTATVSASSPGTGTPTGTVTFKDSGTSIGTGTLSGGQATLATSSLSAGSHSITVDYAGDSSFNTSTTSSALSQTVNQADTTTSVSPSVNPSVSGESVTFTATVNANAPGSGPPSGTVTFKDGLTTLGTGTLSSGQATFSTGLQSVASHSITAVYGGDSSFNPSTSSALSQVVNKANTSTALTSSANPSVVGQLVTFTATVSVNSPGAGAATGTVTFKNGSTVMCTYTLSSGDNGVATCTRTPSSIGSFSVTAEYAGDANVNGSTSSTLSQGVGQASTTTLEISSQNPSDYGQSISLTATVEAVAPGSGTPTGTVTFKDGTTTLGTGTLDGSGEATYTTSSLSAGSHSITAAYNGDSNYGISTSDALSQTVNQASQTVTVSSTVNPSIVNQSVSFSATVPTVSGGATPTGTIQFNVDGIGLSSAVTLTNGSASSEEVAWLAQGDHTVSAEYSGDSNYKSATNTLTQTVTAPLASCTASNNGPVCAGNTLQLLGTTTDTGSDVYYSWTGPNGFTSTNQNPTIPNVTSDNAGTYWLTTGKTGTTNCIESTVVSVAPALTASVSADTVCTGSSGNITATPSGGTAPYTYSWSPGGATNQTISVNDGGTYTVTVTDSTGTGCSVQTSGALTLKPLPVVAIAGVNTTCPNSTNTYSAPAGMSSYAWSVSGAATIDGAANAQTVSVIAAAGCNTNFSLTLAVVSDGCANGTSTNVNVIDTTAPSITSVPADTTVSCANSVPSVNDGAVVATDDCSSVTITHLADVITSSNCPNNFVITRSYIATDACGNSSSASQTITVHDTTGPVITVFPADATYSCSSAVPSADDGSVTASDACGGTVTVTHSDDGVTPGSCANRYTIARTYTVTDVCGNATTQTQNITVSDDTAPVLAGVPGDTTVQCSAVPTAATPTATDNCDSNPNISFNETTAAGSCPGNYTITRVWTATDSCGNSSSGTQVITVVDTTAPVLANVPVDTTVQCDAVPSAGSPTATDNCDSNPTISLGETTAPGSCAGSYVLTRTWTATDICGNHSSASQHITVIDTTAPTIAGVPADTTVQCDAVPTAANATATDNCDTNATITLAETRVDGSCSNNYTLTRTWTATDVCGNSSSKSQTITVIDTGAPTIAGVPADATVQCDNVPVAATPTATDTCDSNPTLTFNETRADGSCANSYTLTRVWTATDVCGNTSTAGQTITVIDTTAPVLAGVPSDVTAQCNVVPTAATPTASDTCDSNPTVTLDETTTAGSCPGNYTITRTWTATDACGNTSTGAQVVTVIDTIAPVLANVPSDVTVQCDALPSAGSPTATDNCDSNPTISLSESTAPGSCAGSYVLTRTWTATDVCGNHSSASQNITVIDTTAPTIAGVPSDTTVQCDAVPTAATATATDNCDTNATISLSETRVDGSCSNSYTLTRTWTASDVCGNTSSKSQVITVIDSTAPVIAGVPDDTTVQCDAVPTAAPATATDNCDTNATIALVETRVDGLCANSYTLTRTWIATDVCGNSSSKSQVITVTDTTAPTIADVPADTTVQCDNVPVAATLTATDNCDSNPNVSFNETRVDGTCASSYVLTRVWTATDICGNTSSATQIVTVTDTTAPVLSVAPADVTVQCDNIPTAATLTATDNCDSSPSVTMNETRVNGSVIGQFVITRTWTATDACGNTSTATQHITAGDSTAPLLTAVPADATVECNAIPSVTTPTVSDNCDTNPTVTLNETTTPGSCSNSYTLTRTWTATDASGNTSTASQTITVHDTTPPVIANVPDDATVQCDGIPAAATLTATDNCDTNATVSLAEISTQTASGSGHFNYTITRTWTASDACGNTSTAAQLITVQDTNAPAFTFVPQDTMAECSSVPSAGTPVVVDNCDTNPTVALVETSTQGSSGCSQFNYTITRTWTATDASGNSSTAQQIVTVHDSTGPVLSAAPGDTTAQCDNVPPAATLTATDNCDSAPAVSFTEVRANGSCAGNYVLTRTWTATDVCGNTSVKTQTVTVIDNTPPLLSAAPADVTVQCDNIPGVATLTATDNCDSSPTVSMDETTSKTTTGSGHYNYTITRTWTATDACGNHSSATQTITVHDSVAPVFGAVPADTTVECNAVPGVTTPTATDNCDSDPTVTLNEVSTQATNGCGQFNYTLTRTWTATDAAGNTSTASQTITVHDISAPTLSTVPTDTTVQCDSVPTAATLTATDNCDTNATVSLAETSTQTPSGFGHYNYTITRTWTASDACGNSSSGTQTISVADTNAPTLVGVPNDTTVQCSAVPPVATVTATDNCDSNPNVDFAETTTPGTNAFNYTITRTWTATDASGNTKSGQQVISVIDSTAPVLSNVPTNMTVVCSGIPPAGTPTVTDSCDTGATVTLSESSTQTASGCGHNNYTITRTWTASDASGNTSTAAQLITVTSEDPTITGFPANATYSCAGQVPSANDTLVTATDSCGGTPVISHDADVISGQTCANRFTITRTYHATTACGDVVSRSQTITVNDTTAPVITGFPADASYTDVSQVPPADDNSVTATDNCGAGVTITHSADQTISGSDVHHFTITRTYTATDACGNSANQTQTFTLVTPAVVTIVITNGVDMRTNKSGWTFKGTAGGENTIASVKYSLNGGPVQTASGTTIWSTPKLTLVGGTNTFVAYAIDTQNNQSTNATAIVFWATSNAFKVVVQDWPHKGGSGSASFTIDGITAANGSPANPIGKKLMVDKTYTIRVSPKPNRRFLGWVYNADTNAPTTSTDTKFDFVYDTNKFLVARFEDPFYYIKGNYTGLFAEDHNVDPRSAGYMTFNMAAAGDTSANKLSSPKILLDGAKYKPQNVTFDMSGHCHFVVQTSSARSGDLTVDLYADLNSSFTGVITGTVASASANWTANVTLYRDADKASLQAMGPERFTLVLPTTGATGLAPLGWTDGTIHRSSTGLLTVAGLLADSGKPWTAQGGRPAFDGHYPLFAQLYKSGGQPNPDGILWGWLQFNNNSSGVAGSLYWSRPHGISSVNGGGNVATYPLGFTNSADIVASVFDTNAIPPLQWTGDGMAFFYDGARPGLTNQMHQSDPYTLKAVGTTQYPLPLKHNYSLHISKTTGLITGGFTDPNDKKTDSVSGVLLQNQEMGSGFFWHTNAGAFLLEQPTN